MRKNKSLRRRPSTPNLKFQHNVLLNQQQQPRHTADPTSPPETPTTSPPLSRKISRKPRHQLPFDYIQSITQDPAIQPVGDGHQFSYRPGLGPEQLSPRSPSSSSSSDEVDDSADDEFSEKGSVGSLPDASEPESSEDEEQSQDAEDELSEDELSEDELSEDDDSEPERPQPRATVHIKTTTTITTMECDFVIEDVDAMDSECDGLDILFPTEIESNRSRSPSRHKDLDKGMMQDLQNLNCSNEASDDEPDTAFYSNNNKGFMQQPEIELDEDAFLRRRAELKRIRRVSMSSSFGKRTHSELSDSDGDDAGPLDINDVGSSARRMRKRLHRGSLLFQDPPAPRIDELDEPDSSEDEFAAEQSLARELPYYTIEIIEAESA